MPAGPVPNVGANESAADAGCDATGGPGCRVDFPFTLWLFNIAMV